MVLDFTDNISIKCHQPVHLPAQICKHKCMQSTCGKTARYSSSSAVYRSQTRLIVMQTFNILLLSPHHQCAR